MTLGQVAAKLRGGETVEFQAFGNSMNPLIRSGAIVKVAPLNEEEEIEAGTVVLARVRGRYYLHHAAAIRAGQVRIDNHAGRSNGWTARRNVLGRMVAA